jgi:hypothetical protein
MKSSILKTLRTMLVPTTSQCIPRNAAEAQRAGSDIHGGSYSPLEPLGRMVFQKCSKQPTLPGNDADGKENR